MVYIRTIDSALHCSKDDPLCSLHRWLGVPEKYEARSCKVLHRRLFFRTSVFSLRAGGGKDYDDDDDRVPTRKFQEPYPGAQSMESCNKARVMRRIR